MSSSSSFDESDMPDDSMYGHDVIDPHGAEHQREIHLSPQELKALEAEFSSSSEDEDVVSFNDASVQHTRDTRQESFEPDPRLKTSPSPAASAHINQNQAYGHVNYINIKTSTPHVGEFHQNYGIDSQGHRASKTAEECNNSDIYLNLPNTNQKQNDVPASESQPWLDGRYQFSSIPNNYTTVATKQATHPVGNENCRHNFVLSQPEAYFVPALTGESLPVKTNVRTANELNMDDERILPIKEPTMSPYHNHKSQQYSHVQYRLGDNHQQLPRHSANCSSNHLQHSSTSVITNQNSAASQPEGIVNSGTLPKSEANLNLPQHSQPHRSQPHHFQPQCSGTSSSSPLTLPFCSSTPLSSSVIPSQPSGISRDNQNGQQMLRNIEFSQIPDAGDGQFWQYKVQYQKPGLDKVGEEQFYLDNEDMEFILKDGPEDRREYEQLEILYRARGREIEEKTRKMGEIEEEKCKEIRSLKHKLSMATGESETMGESLRQYQALLQQASSEKTDAVGKIRALEIQVQSLKDANEEIIKKHQAAESTIENMTHHIEGLQNSEILSRARNEHEAIVSNLTSRYEKELLAVKEKLDVSKAALETKQDELVFLKKQLADATLELQQTLISRGETINGLNRSLEDSQRQCKMLLEQSSGQELSLLRVQLQQALASKRISEDLCKTYQSEIKELKEQLNMLESASNLGVFSLPSHGSSAACHDDSMADLGIKKTLNFDSPKSVTGYNGPQASDELIASLRSELEKCLRTNKQKRSEVAEKVEEIKTLRATVEEAQNRIITLDKTCLEQKNRLQEVDFLGCSGGGVTIVEARMRREIEDLKREKEVLLGDIEDYKLRLQEIGESEAKLTEINAELNQQIGQMVNDSDADKRAALESYQRTMEEVSRMSIEKLRQEIEERFQSEKTMLTEHYRQKVNDSKQQLSSTLLELDNVKTLYIKTCEESSAREVMITEKFQKQMEEELGKLKDKQELEKREWECFMRDELRKEQEAFKKSSREIVESELRKEYEEKIQVKVAQTKQACLEEQRAVRQTMIDEALTDARKQWQQERDLQKWPEERCSDESELAMQNQQTSDLKEKIDMQSVNGKESIQKLELEFQAKLKSLEKQHKEEMNELVLKSEREMADLEQKLSALCKQFSLTEEKDKMAVFGRELSSTENSSKKDQRSNGSDLLWKLTVLEEILNKKDMRLKELEKMLDNEDGAVLKRSCTTLEARLIEKEDEVKMLEMKLAAKDGGDSSVKDRADNNFVEKNLKVNGLNFHEREGIFDDKNVTLEKMLETYKGNNLSEYCSRFNAEGGFVWCDNNPEKMMEHIKKLESNLNIMKQKYNKDIDDLKQQHQKENEKAARIREEKFQAELRYFLKEKDEKCKLEIHKAICGYEEKKKMELQKVIEEYEERMKRESDNSVFLKQKLEFEESKDKMQCEIDKLREKYFDEKETLEKEMKQLKEEKNNEIVSLIFRHNVEKQEMKEKFENDLDKMKLEHERIANNLRQKLESQTADAEITKRLLDSLKRESDTDKKVAEQLKKEVEMLKVSVKDAQGVAEQIQEQRSKWFQESQEYINREIKRGIEDKVKEEQEKMKKDLEKIREWEVKKGNLEKTIQEKIQKELEMHKENLERDKKEEVRRRVEVEIENLKKKFMSELEVRVVKEKSRLEQEALAWKEEEKKRMEEDRNKMFRSDIERTLQEERKRMEHEMNQSLDNKIRDIREEMEEKMRKRIQKERVEWDRQKAESESSGNGSGVGWKERLQAEIEARTKACNERDKAIEYLRSRELWFREEKQKIISGVKKDLEESKKEHVVLEEKYAEMGRKYKADMHKAKQREKDLAKQKMKLDEEKENLVASYKAQVIHLQDEFDATLQQVKKKGEREMINLLKEVQKQAELNSLAVQLPDASSSTILELRDLYLDTVAKIKADVMAHSENANMQAALTMKAEIHKQRQKVIEIFRTKCKANIRSALRGQVPETTITALEHSMDLLSEHLIAVTTSVSGSTNKHPNKKNNIGDKLPISCEKTFIRKDFDSENIDEGILGKAKLSVDAGITEAAEVLPGSDQLAYYSPVVRENRDADFEQPVLERDEKVKFIQDKCPPHYLHYHPESYEHQQRKRMGSHPQLEKVDLFDSDTHLHTPSSSNNSSPASQTRVRSASMKHHVTMPDIPSLTPDTTRTRPASSKTTSSLKSNVETADFPSTVSPRDDRKVLKARVLLANWAVSGEMQWKVSGEKSGMKNVDSDGFVKPGQEAEQWLRTQKQTSDSKQPGDRTNNNTHGYYHLQFSSDSTEDSCSSGTNISFMTLEPEVVENSVRKYLSLGTSVALPLPSQKNKAVSVQNENNFCVEKREKALRDTRNENCDDVDSDYHGNFGSQESVNSLENNHFPNDKPANVYSKVRQAIPTSTPVMKGLKVNEELRSRGEGSSCLSEKWKSIGGPTFFECQRDANRQSAPEHESGKHLKPNCRVHSPQPNSLLKKSSRSRSLEGNGENLVMKSAEFPSELSRITQGSTFEQSSLWRYKSLEDLIPHLQRSDQEGEEMKAGMRDVLVKTAGTGPYDVASQGRLNNQKKVEFVSRPDQRHAPVMAMNSEFWEQQSEDWDDRSKEQTSHRPFIEKQSGFLKSNGKVINSSEDKKSSPTRHKTPRRKRRQSPDFKESSDTIERFGADSDWQTTVHSESRSEPQVSKRQLSHEEKVPSSKYRLQDVPSDHRIQEKQLLSALPSASSAFMREVTDLRRSLEEIQPLQFLQQSSPRKSAQNSKMTKSSSEQSLHTLHLEPQGHGHNLDSDIDALISTYTTSQSHFDLRPFPHDEHF